MMSQGQPLGALPQLLSDTKLELTVRRSCCLRRFCHSYWKREGLGIIPQDSLFIPVSSLAIQTQDLAANNWEL